jgi:hypothetical protein
VLGGSFGPDRTDGNSIIFQRYRPELVGSDTSGQLLDQLL